MFKIQGKFNEAVVYASTVDPKAIEQILELCNQEFTYGAKIRIMSDVHPGKGCTIGTTMTITDKVVPNLVGVDIGCGVTVAELTETDLSFEKLDEVIRKKIPAGFQVRNKVLPIAGKVPLTKLRCRGAVSIERAEKSIGTLGGGNHFIEVNSHPDTSRIYLVVHSGSRHLGTEVAKYYQEKAYEEINNHAMEREELIKALKRDNRQNEIARILKLQKKAKTPKALSYLEGPAFEDYLHDMQIVQQFADIKRRALIQEIVKDMQLHIKSLFSSVHNYIDTETMVLRKGAISADAGQQLVIPINMRDGSIIGTGRGNDDWNQSAPHGAGRLLSRGEAKDRFTLNEYKESMKEIWSTSVAESTIDECPMAYKPIQDILSQIEDTVTIEAVIKPLYNFKSGN